MKSTYKILFIAGILLSITLTTRAQLNLMGAQYFNNQYAANPAFAGTNEGIKLNFAYRSMWSNIEGTPVTQNLTADYGFEKVGLGINLLNESAGLQRQTRVVGSYAYHLLLNNGTDRLNFGISVGFMNQRLENSAVSGEESDPIIDQYNDRKTYIDGDFGIAYTSNHLNVQAAIPNLKTFFKKDELKQADVATFYSAISYRINFGAGIDAIEVEPKLIYRGIKGFDNIWDAGAQIGISDRQILFMAMYHSMENATFGIGMDLKKKYLVNVNYTTNTAALSGFTNGNFELNLRLNLSK